MFVERFFVEGLAHASYLFGADGEAAVVDPKRDVEDYLAAAARYGVRIVAIFETHPHADFVSGHMDLADATDAPIFVSEKYPAKFPHRALPDGGSVAVGGLQVIGLDTPGHSPDSMSFYVDAGDERVVFSGDTLFVGDVGRPDLRDMHSDPREMASALYDSLHEVFWKLPDDTVVYPAHGAGSLCGRRLGSAPSSTIGDEKVSNWVNRFSGQEEFVDAMLANLPDRPIFFYHSPFTNLEGPRLLRDVPKPGRISPAELQERFREALVLDTRNFEAYGAGHPAGSLHVGLELPVFSTWVGTFVKPSQPLVLVVNDEAAAEKAWLELARIGYECAVAYLPANLSADLSAWKAAGLEILETPQLEVTCLEAWVEEGRNLLDVRTSAEWNDGAVEGAVWIPLTKLPGRVHELRAGPHAVLCGSGYRSSIAASLLEQAGRRDIVNVPGGWSAYRQMDGVEPDSQDLFCQELFDRMPVI
jgi:hydroxyacylglutathione hydrolase